MGAFVKGDADSNIILYRAGVLTETKLQEVVAKIVQIMTG